MKKNLHVSIPFYFQVKLVWKEFEEDPYHLHQNTFNSIIYQLLIILYQLCFSRLLIPFISKIKLKIVYLITVEIPLSAQIFKPLGWAFNQEKRLIKALQYS